MKDIKYIRREIDNIDKIIFDCLNKRIDLMNDVLDYKISNNMQIFDSKREQEKLDSIDNKMEKSLLLLIMAICKVVQYERLDQISKIDIYNENKININKEDIEVKIMLNHNNFYKLINILSLYGIDTIKCLYDGKECKLKLNVINNYDFQLAMKMIREEIK